MLLPKSQKKKSREEKCTQVADTLYRDKKSVLIAGQIQKINFWTYFLVPKMSLI